MNYGQEILLTDQGNQRLKNKVLGIIGGMGPQATVCAFNKILKATNAQTDQDHLEIIIHNNTNIPDRTQAILNNGSSPMPELLRSGLMLEKLGVDFIIIPCITAHYYFENLQRAIRTPMIHAIQETSLSIGREYPGINNVGILATTGTIKANLFQLHLAKYDITSILLPDSLQTKLVMHAIYGEKGIKAGYLDSETKGKLLEAGQYLIEHGAGVIIGGCTEVPLVIRQDDFSVPFIDPIEILATIAVRKCLA